MKNIFKFNGDNVFFHQLDSKVWVPPGIYPVSQLDVGDIKAIYYDGLAYQGKATRVFAYIGHPSGASTVNKVPAIVLVHGGGGTALADWVKVWTDKGYAAIAMDLEGNRPSIPGGYASERQPYGGPARKGFFEDIHYPITEQWMYHAVAGVILAHSLLRSDPVINTSKIGLTGISWGGVVSSIVIGLDDRFAFAIPVYGCGYLPGQQSRLSLEFRSNPDANMWEPSRWIRHASMPVMWINSDSDPFFSAASTSLSFENTPDANIAIINGFAHNHQEGWSRGEIYAFADSIANNGIPLIKVVEQPSVSSNFIRLSIPPGVTVSSSAIFYSLSGDIYSEDGMACLANWQKEQATIDGDTIRFDVPENTKAYYIAVCDNRGLIVSSKLVEN